MSPMEPETTILAEPPPIFVGYCMHCRVKQPFAEGSRTEGLVWTWELDHKLSSPRRRTRRVGVCEVCGYNMTSIIKSEQASPSSASATDGGARLGEL
jgi:hypothetical protein